MAYECDRRIDRRTDRTAIARNGVGRALKTFETARNFKIRMHTRIAFHGRPQQFRQYVSRHSRCAVNESIECQGFSLLRIEQWTP